MPLRFIFSLSILFFVLAACKKDEDPPVEPPTSANIVGTVTLYDEGTTQLESSGMIVSVYGQSITTTTDDNGAFTLENVSFGDRTLIFEKDGYGIFKHVVEHETDGTPTFITQNFPLGQNSSTQITSISAEESGGNIVVGHHLGGGWRWIRGCGRHWNCCRGRLASRPPTCRLPPSGKWPV